jgi:hypothetical protein
MTCKSLFVTLLAELWRIVSSIFILTAGLLLFVYVLHFWYSGAAHALAQDFAALANGGLQSLDLFVLEFRSAMRTAPDPGLLSRLLKSILH